MSKKGLLTLVLGGTALIGAGYASSSNAARAVVPIEREIIGVAVDTGNSIPTRIHLPSRPPGRSLYRPGPRNPPTVLE